MIHAVLLWKAGGVDRGGSEAGEIEGCEWGWGERRAHGSGTNAACAETVEERGAIGGGHLEWRILKDWYN